MAAPTETTPAGGVPKEAFEIHRQMVIALFIATFALSVVLALGLIFSRFS